jgi:hypothetical protein
MHLIYTLYGIHGLHSFHGLQSFHFLHGLVGLHGIALRLGHLQKDANKRNMQLKLLDNDIGGLAGLALGHLQVHARNGEHKHMGWKANLLINMHGLDKPTRNANIHGVYKHT